MPYFRYEDFNLFYEVKGDLDSEKVVVFLNGVMVSTNSWVNQVKLFEMLGYKIILHDFKGQLLSDKPTGPYSFAEHAKEAKALLDHLGVSKAHFVGTSYGGEVGLKIAIQYPNIVQSLSVIDSVSELDEVLTLFVKGWLALAESGDPEKFYYGMLPTVYHNDYINANLESIHKRAKAFNKLPNDFFTGQIELYKTFEQDVFMTDSLHLISAPTLVVCGEDDILKPKKFSKVIADNIGDSEYVTIPDCGHVTILEKPNELNSVLLGFITKHSLN